jgi:hypothetical protein
MHKQSWHACCLVCWCVVDHRNDVETAWLTRMPTILPIAGDWHTLALRCKWREYPASCCPHHPPPPPTPQPSTSCCSPAVPAPSPALPQQVLRGGDELSLSVYPRMGGAGAPSYVYVPADGELRWAAGLLGSCGDASGGMLLLPWPPSRCFSTSTALLHASSPPPPAPSTCPLHLPPPPATSTCPLHLPPPPATLHLHPPPAPGSRAPGSRAPGMPPPTGSPPWQQGQRQRC